MNVYTYFRAEGFYPIELENDELALACVECNPGTLKVINENTGRVVYGDGCDCGRPLIRYHEGRCIICGKPPKSEEVNGG